MNGVRRRGETRNSEGGHSRYGHNSTASEDHDLTRTPLRRQGDED
jgi:hypothetical protein